MKKEDVLMGTRWAFVGLAILFLSAALGAIAYSWQHIQLVIGSGDWDSGAYLFTFLLFGTFAFSVWCLSLSGFGFDKLMDSITILAVVLLIILSLMLLIGKPAETQSFLPFVLLLVLLIAVHIWIQKLIQKFPAVLVLTTFFPLFSLASLVLLYRYLYMGETAWEIAQHKNGWIIMAYILLAIIPSMMLVAYRKYLIKEE